MISIIVPIYKVEKYLPRCIDSLINQTYKNIEIILVDDGSPDECSRICDKYAARDERIVVIHQKNAGVSSARNAGLKAAKGDYIGFCDPDDWTAPEMYEELLHAMKDYAADLSVCGYNYYDEENSVDVKRLYKERDPEVLDQRSIMDRMCDIPPSIRHGVWNKLFLKSVLRDQQLEEKIHYSEDVLFLTDYLCKIERAVIVHKPLYRNLVRKGSATHGGASIETLTDSVYAHEYMYTSIVRCFPELRDRALAYLLDAFTLTYKEMKLKLDECPPEERRRCCGNVIKVRNRIRRFARLAILDREIYWKTRIAYLIMS